MGKGSFLGEFERLVLLALLRVGNEGYGMTVRQELEQTTGRAVTIGAVYATLARLEEKGLLSSWHVDPEPHRGGRSRRFFRVETSGRKALAESRAVLDRMWAGVDVADEVQS
ncbi:MAG: PadR family transcriptional regulator [Acidobacteria bacterium]|nr:PadR family transcriptional regulator [Acidobacteriota bacterium]